MTEAAHPEPSAASPAVLCVDDEPNITRALVRAFRQTGYRVLVATSGEAGLRLMSSHHVDVVISDMRMPEMDGVTFLQNVRRRFPLAGRMLLTGHADIGDTIAAINRGEIHRYVGKPWDEQELLLTVAQLIERQALESRNRELESRTHLQNEALQVLNESLEALVAEKTAELTSALEALTRSHQRLDDAFFRCVRMVASVIELHSPMQAAHCRRVAAMARRMAGLAGLAESQIRDIHLAGLLHDIGMVGLPPEVFERPEPALDPVQRGLRRAHPVRGAALLASMQELEGVACIVRSQHERFDGGGYPDRLGGDAVPLGSALVRVASDFDEQACRDEQGLSTARPTRAGPALAQMRLESGRAYPPRAVALLALCVARGGATADGEEPPVEHPGTPRESALAG